MKKSFIHKNRQKEFLGNIIAERYRQMCKLESGSIPWDCANPTVMLNSKLVVLGEENGECCRAGLEGTNLKEELIQLAAVACAIYESLP